MFFFFLGLGEHKKVTWTHICYIDRMSLVVYHVYLKIASQVGPSGQVHSNDLIHKSIRMAWHEPQDVTASSAVSRMANILSFRTESRALGLTILRLCSSNGVQDVQLFRLITVYVLGALLRLQMLCASVRSVR
jgi:hypothetical protein